MFNAWGMAKPGFFNRPLWKYLKNYFMHFHGVLYPEDHVHLKNSFLILASG